MERGESQCQQRVDDSGRNADVDVFCGGAVHSAVVRLADFWMNVAPTASCRVHVTLLNSVPRNVTAIDSMRRVLLQCCRALQPCRRERS